MNSDEIQSGIERGLKTEACVTEAVQRLLSAYPTLADVLEVGGGCTNDLLEALRGHPKEAAILAIAALLNALVDDMCESDNPPHVPKLGSLTIRVEPELS